MTPTRHSTAFGCILMLAACAGTAETNKPTESAASEPKSPAHQPYGMAHMLPPESIAELQEALQSRGYVLQVTSRFDRATERALRAHQAAHGLAATGLPDMATLRSLALRPAVILSAPTHSGGQHGDDGFAWNEGSCAAQAE